MIREIYNYTTRRSVQKRTDPTATEPDDRIRPWKG